VLDNCEHLLAACAALLDALLRRCPDLRVLATSREALGILGETTYRIPGLSLPPSVESEWLMVDGKGEPAFADPSTTNPPPSTLLQSEAVRLFLDRAAAVESSFALTAQNAGAVARICRRLDGIPLALEMAAARVRALPVESLAERLGDCFRLLTDGNRAALPRHRTLRAMIEWSHDLLSEPERVLLRRLSVFAGGWTLEAAEAVCSNFGFPISDFGAGPGPKAIPNPKSKIQNGDVLDLLTMLVDKSMVVYENRAEGGRYHLLETTRQFAQECLVASGEVGTTRQRHVECYLRLAETAESHLSSPSPLPWLDRLERELGNLRAVLAWTTERPGSAPEAEAVEVGLRLAAAVRHFWQVRGYATEGRDWLAKLLAFTEAEASVKARVSTAVRAKALYAVGWLAWPQGDGNATRAHLQQSLALARELGDRWLIASSLNSLGNISECLAEYEVARAQQEESLSIFRSMGDQWMVASLCNNLSNTARDQGDFGQALSLAEESIRIRCELGDRAATRMPLIVLGSIRMLQGDYPAALPYFEESLAISRPLGDVRVMAIALCKLGALARYQGDMETARARYGASIRLHHRMGNRGELMVCLVGLGCVEIVTGENGRRPDPEAEAWFARGARLFGAAEGLRRATGWVIGSIHRDDYPQRVTAARAALGEAAFAAAWAEGRAMSLEAAVADALEEGGSM
jgi:predicted ATPase